MKAKRRSFPKDYKAMIDKYGYMVMQVHPYPERHNRHFAYTIGLSENHNHPEILAFSFGGELSAAIVRAVAKFVIDGGVIEPGKAFHDFAPTPYFFKEIDQSHYEEKLGFAFLRYGFEFKCYQCFTTDRESRFPWDAGFVDDPDIQSQPDLTGRAEH